MRHCDHEHLDTKVSGAFPSSVGAPSTSTDIEDIKQAQDHLPNTKTALASTYDQVRLPSGHIVS
jgi:hypothetical protein